VDAHPADTRLGGAEVDKVIEIRCGDLDGLVWAWAGIGEC